MARFRFRLQPVLDVRTRVQDERARELALKQRDHSEAEAAHAALEAEREAQRAALSENHRAFDVDALRATYAHLAYLDRAIDDAAVRVAACADEVERAQRQLLAATTDRKILETLRTQRHEAFTSDAALVEQRETDDQNARRYGRAQAKGEDHR
jgi:flagellar export protein FliJ